MIEVELTSEINVKLIRSMASDETVVQAAQVSAKGENNPETVPLRLINALMREQHGSPFEHNAMTFFIEAPLFVFRQWMKHRISSFNEMSARYTKLQPKFYIPAETRKMINYGTKMKPKFSYDRNGAGNRFRQELGEVSDQAWFSYEAALNDGVSEEIARMVLPVNVYSQMYWTVNARSLMNFLALRVQSENSMFVSYPQWEIETAALQIETIFADLMPATYIAFVENGRIAP